MSRTDASVLKGGPDSSILRCCGSVVFTTLFTGCMISHEPRGTSILVGGLREPRSLLVELQMLKRPHMRPTCRVHVGCVEIPKTLRRFIASPRLATIVCNSFARPSPCALIEEPLESRSSCICLRMPYTVAKSRDRSLIS